MSNTIPQQPIDRNSFIPFYIQVKNALTEYIEDNKFPPGHQFPGEADLCTAFDVSRTVIRQALREMETLGLIYRVKGRGTFIAEPKIRESLFQELTGFYQDMISKGYRPKSTVLKQEIVAANKKVAAYLELKEGAQIIQIDRLRFVNQEPIVLTSTYLPYEICAPLLEIDLANQSLYAYLEREHGLYITRGKRFFEAVIANPMEAEMLQIEAGSPLILINSISYLADGTPLEYYHAVHRGDRSRFETELIRVNKPGELAIKLEFASKSS
ncbi:MAG: GntR family transcriptional regulator [Anaerolineaceae bacterium]|nr:GntR family transcriptional regulator [Anaerolineaceae bacterium]